MALPLLDRFNQALSASDLSFKTLIDRTQDGFDLKSYEADVSEGEIKGFNRRLRERILGLDITAEDLATQLALIIKMSNLENILDQQARTVSGRFVGRVLSARYPFIQKGRTLAPFDPKYWALYAVQTQWTSGELTLLDDAQSFMYAIGFQQQQVIKEIERKRVEGRRKKPIGSFESGDTKAPDPDLAVPAFLNSTLTLEGVELVLSGQVTCHGFAEGVTVRVHFDESRRVLILEED